MEYQHPPEPPPRGVEKLVVTITRLTAEEIAAFAQSAWYEPFSGPQTDELSALRAKVKQLQSILRNR